MNTRRTTLLIAIVLALGTGWLALSYITSLQHSNEQAQGQPTQVLVASQAIPARTQITVAMVKVVSVPSTALQPGVLNDPSKAAGSFALVAIPANAQITATEVGANASSSLPVRLQEGMRAVSIPIDKVKAVAGLIEPGDRVDVIAIQPRQGDADPVAETIIRGTRVLAIGSISESNSSSSSSSDTSAAGTATLEVTPKEADTLAMADANTTLRLALRSPKEPIRSQSPETLVWGAVSAPGAAPSPAAIAAAPAVPAQAAPAAHPRSGVQVIVGDQVQQQ